MLTSRTIRSGITLGLFAGMLVAYSSDASAQPLKGGEVRVPAVTTAEEQLSQSDLWVMDVYFKPMRMIAYERTDPKTGQKKLEHAWYIVYRAFNHKLELKGRENPAVNVSDPPIAPPQFVPSAILVTTDNDRNDVFEDQVIPEAIAAINKREKGNYKNSVSIVGSVPEPSVPGSPEDKPLEGVFVWRGVDPDANRYTVYLTGFSNGLRKVPIEKAEGEKAADENAEGDEQAEDSIPAFQTKTIMQKYWRRGDRFDQRESEIVLDGDSNWIYR